MNGFATYKLHCQYGGTSMEENEEKKENDPGEDEDKPKKPTTVFDDSDIHKEIFGMGRLGKKFGSSRANVIMTRLDDQDLKKIDALVEKLTEYEFLLFFWIFIPGHNKDGVWPL
jgi:hypothetical protein